MDENTKKLFEKRLELLSKESPEALMERVKLMRAAVEMQQNYYWKALEENLRNSIKEYFDYKKHYSFAGKYIDQSRGNLEEIKMITAEAKTEDRIEILDQIQFHIEDGKLAEIALRQVKK